MDDKTKADIGVGVPMVIAHWDKAGNEISQEAYNLGNISISKWQMESLARTIIEGCRRFYANPENVTRFEEWQTKKNAETKRQEK